jgi:ribosomal-protein-alanine N-acetyltransferase
MTMPGNGGDISPPGRTDGVPGATLHDAGPAYGDVLAALQRACFPKDPWPAASIRDMLGIAGTFACLAVTQSAGQGRVTGAGDGDRLPLGFIIARVIIDDAEVLALGVHPTARRAGVAAWLLGEALARAKRRGATAMFLEVAEDNAPARALYDRAGFVAVGRRPGYYRRADGRVAATVLRYNFGTGQ